MEMAIKPREVVESPSPGIFKLYIDVALRTWFSGGLGSVKFIIRLNLKGVSNPKHSMILQI